MGSMDTKWIIFVVVGALVVYRIFGRLRRTFTWQQLKPGRLRFVTILFGVVGVLFFIEGALYPISLISDIAGVLAGVVLAGYGFVHTQFERQGSQLMYRPNAWIGGVVTILFVGRLAYRIYLISQTSGDGQGAQWADQMGGAGHTWTSGLMLIMFAYYATYNLLLLRKLRG